MKCCIDHRPLAVKPFATSGVTQAFLVLCQGLIILGSDAKKSQHLQTLGGGQSNDGIGSGPNFAPWQLTHEQENYMIYGFLLH